MKTMTTEQMSESIKALATSMGLTLHSVGIVERWERDGVMHAFVGKCCIEFCGSDNHIFGDNPGGSVIITGTVDEDFCEPLRKAGIWNSDLDFSETFTDVDGLKAILTKVRPFI